MPADLRFTPTLTCACGKEMQPLAGDFYHCRQCGRAKWASEDISAALITFIAVLTVVVLIVLGIVGINGAKYR